MPNDHSKQTIGVVKEYFKSFSARNIKSSKISSTESLYTMTKDGQEYEFLVKHNVL